MNAPDFGRDSSDDTDDRLFGIIADYLSAAEAGTPPDRNALLNRHAEFEDDLRSFFANFDQLQGLAGSVAPPRLDSGQLSGTEQTAPVGPATLGIPPSLRAGSRFGRNGDYHLEEELGRGGMGIVFRARQESLNRTVAVKMILSGGLAREEEVKRFHAEAEAAAALEHPGIVPVYETDEHDGCHYFSMGYVEGESLADRLHQGPLAPREAARLLCSITEAVAYAHSADVIHRDLKPHNILLDRDGEPKITDFGLAKRMTQESDLTATGQILGTPSYMPPEQATALHDAIGPAADVYSLGAILYATLTGRPPFQAANPADVLIQVQRQEPVAPRALSPRVPQDLETICMKCLEKQPARRYPSARDLADELARFLRGEPIHARPVGRLAKTGRWCLRNPLAASLVAVITIVAIASPWVAFRYRQLADRESQAHAAADALAMQERRAREEADAQRARANLEAEHHRRSLYITSMVAAKSAWESDQIAWAVGLLESHIPRGDEADLRSFEWYYLWKLCHPGTVPLGPHPRGVNCVAFSPDGRQVATGCIDRRIRIFDAATGRLEATLEGHQGEVTSVRYLPGDVSQQPLLVSAGSDQTLRFWTLADASEWVAARQKLAEQAVSLAGSPGGELVAAGLLNGDVVLVDTTSPGAPAGATDTLTRVVGSSGLVAINAVDFAPDGRRIAFCTKNSTIEVWDVATRTRKAVHRLPAPVLSISFSPDGDRIAAAGRDLVAIWEPAGDNLQVLAKFSGVASSVQFSPREDRLLAVSRLNSGIELWDAEQQVRLMPLRRHEAAVKAVAFSPDGERLVSGGADGMAHVWDLQQAVRSRQRETLQGRPPIADIAFANEGELLVAAQHNEIATWNLATRQRQTMGGDVDSQILCLAQSRDARQFAVGTIPGTLFLWSPQDSTRPRKLTATPGVFMGLAFLPGDRQLLSVVSQPVAGGIWKSDLRVFDVASETRAGQPTANKTHAATVHPSAMAVSPDARSLALGGVSGRIELIELASGSVMDSVQPHRDTITAMAFSRDQEIVASASRDLTVAFWRRERDEVVVKRRHNQMVTAIAFSPDGKTVATGGNDKEVKLWDVESCRVKVTLRAGDGIKALAFAPNGLVLVAALYNGQLRVWDAELPPSANPAQDGHGHR